MSRAVLGRSSRAILLTCLVATALWSASASPAGAASDIEGVWAFNGGEIAVQPAADGMFVGTVVTETTFAECVHPVGQQIWTDITPQPDGSYWGLHQWYTEVGCTLVPTGGKTAFRVLEGPNGTHYLRVCLSHPGTSQPRIAPSGLSTETTWGCTSSALSAPLPAPGSPVGAAPVPGNGTTGANPNSSIQTFDELVSLPSNKKCFRVRSFQIRITDPKDDAFKTVTIMLRGRKLRTSRHGRTIVETVSSRAIPRGTFAVQIRALTYLGRHLSGSRTYHPCKPRQR